MHRHVQAELDAMTNDTGDLATAAKVEGLDDEAVGQGPTMMGRQARQLMMSGQGDAGLQAFKVRCTVTPHQEAVCAVCRHNRRLFEPYVGITKPRIGRGTGHQAYWGAGHLESMGSKCLTTCYIHSI